MEAKLDNAWKAIEPRAVFSVEAEEFFRPLGSPRKK